MQRTLRRFVVAGTLAAFASPALAQVNSNNSTLNNGGDVLFLYSSPSSGSTAGANPPDVGGDWFYKVWEGAGTLNHVTSLGSVMEVDGFYESLFDTFWGTVSSPASSPADFYTRTLGPAVPSTTNPGILEPLFVTAGFTTETVVVVGNSGFGNPCTSFPSLCSPPGSTCPPSGFVNGYLVELNFSSTPGTGVVLPADGTSASDTALTYFVNGGMSATGGVCGLGDYGVQDVHSTDETQADVAGGLNVAGGFQLGGGSPQAEAVTSMLESNLTFRDRLLQIQADSGAGVEVGDNGGGATNGVRLPVATGLSSIGVEVRDLASSFTPNVTVVGASLTPIPNPGIPVFGGEANLLVVPDGVFNATSGAWTGSTLPTVFTFTSEGAFTGAQLPIGAAAGINLYAQGVVVDLVFPPGGTFRSTNRARTGLGLVSGATCVLEILDAGCGPTDHLDIGHWGADDGGMGLDGYGAGPGFAVKNGAGGVFIDTDPDRFFVRATDPDANQNPAVREKVKASVSTTGGSVTDDPTEIELLETDVNTGVFKSEALLLTTADIPATADDFYAVYSVRAGATVADDALNDRTHRTNIEGEVVVTYTCVSEPISLLETRPVCDRSPEERRLLRVRVTVLQEAPGKDVSGDGVVNTVLGPMAGVQAIVDAEIARANVHWAQACIKIQQVGATRILAAPAPGGTNIFADCDLDIGVDDLAIAGDAAIAAGVSPNILEVIWVANIPGALGITRAPECGLAAIGGNTYVFLGIPAAGGVYSPSQAVLAHEIGHALDNLPSQDGGQPKYVYYPAGSAVLDDAVNAFRRIRHDTEAACRIVRPPGAASYGLPGNTLLIPLPAP